MLAGKMDRRITLQHRAQSAADAQGQKIETFAAYASVWAQKEDMSSREFIAAQQANAERTTKFSIRWRSDVLNTDRLLDENGVSYNIRQIVEIGRHVGLEITATALVS